MAEFSQKSRPLRVTLGRVDPDAVAITAFAGTETLSRLYRFTLELVAPADSPLKFEDVLGQAAVVEIDQADGQTRFVHGIVNRLSQGRRDNRFVHYRAELVPRLWMLTKQSRSRIFQQKNVRTILEEVIGGLYSPRFDLEAEYFERNYCVQYRESDFAFVSRLMEEEGIYYYFTHSEDGQELVICDHPRGHDPLPHGPTLIFQDAALAVPNEGRVTRWDKAQELRAGAVDLTDHWFEMPTNDLRAVALPLDTAKAGSVEHKLVVADTDKLSVVDHPGGYARFRDGVAPGGADRADDLQRVFDENGRLSIVRMEQEQVGALAIDAEATYCRLTAGHAFTLAEHYDADGEYVVTSVLHRAACGIGTSGEAVSFTYANSFACIPADISFRPARETPRPFIRGTQTAVVVGDDPEIDPDKYGRVKVWLRWDLEGQRGLDTSCWVRVAQSWAGRQWGSWFLPRVGDEVVVAFLEGDPDQPLVIGSVYNAENMPIYGLPKNKTQTGIKTHSSPGGNSENFNELRFEDKKGHEQIVIHAEKDMATTVEDNHSLSIGGGAKSTDPKKTGTSTTTTFGDTRHTITKGNYSFGVHAGKADYFVKGPVKEVFDDTHSTTVTNGIDNVSKSAHIRLTASTEIVLTVGGSQLTIKPDSITLKSANIHFDGGTNLTGKAPHIAFDGGTDITAKAPALTIDGTSTAAYQGGTVDVTGRSRMTAGVDGQTVMCDGGKVVVCGAKITASASGTHEITGALVKIN